MRRVLVAHVDRLEEDARVTLLEDGERLVALVHEEARDLAS